MTDPDDNGLAAFADVIVSVIAGAFILGGVAFAIWVAVSG